jgi:hypothetical protein
MPECRQRVRQCVSSEGRGSRPASSCTAPRRTLAASGLGTRGRRALLRHHSRPFAGSHVFNNSSTIMARSGSKLYGFAWLLGLKWLPGAPQCLWLPIRHLIPDQSHGPRVRPSVCGSSIMGLREKAALRLKPGSGNGTPPRGEPPLVKKRRAKEGQKSAADQHTDPHGE